MLSSSIQTTDIKYELVQNMDRGYLRVIDSVDPVVEGDSPGTIPEAVTLLVQTLGNEFVPGILLELMLSGPT